MDTGSYVKSACDQPWVEHIRAHSFRLVVIVSMLLVLLAGLSLGAEKAPKRIATAKPGNCVVCHTQKVLPADHASTKVMTYKDCVKCHEKAGPQKLEGRLPGSHIHALNGITCARCHGKTKKPAEVEMKQCVACHKAEKMVERTAGVKPANPHTSPHYGPDLDCNLCHHQHAKSEDYCKQCHNFGFVVP